MARDDRFYAFIVPQTSRSRARIRRICVEKKALKLFALAALILFCVCLYGFYGLTQQAQHFRTETENQRLRAENERQRQELNELSNRVEAVEDTSRKLAEKSGVVNENADLPGTGGPAMPLEPDSLPALEEKMTQLEDDMHAYEAVLRMRGYTPSVWPVVGKLESAFGGVGILLAGALTNFTPARILMRLRGAPVIAGATGKVSFVGWQNGYGQLVVIDHGGGLTTRYGHLSHIAVPQGATVMRGELVGKVGSTGRSTGPHLHYEVRINDEPVNPLQYLLTTAR